MQSLELRDLSLGIAYVAITNLTLWAFAALQGAGAPFSTFDILQDEEVRQGLKKFSNWPTYPQL